jgi:hypothetical protein
MADTLIPDSTTKQSTVGALLSGGAARLETLFSGGASTASGLAAGGATTSPSFFANPIVWVAVVVAGVVVYFAKFKGSSRKSVKFRK